VGPGCFFKRKTRNREVELLNRMHVRIWMWLSSPCVGEVRGFDGAGQARRGTERSSLAGSAPRTEVAIDMATR
jgi:hypothetical protein